MRVWSSLRSSSTVHGSTFIDVELEIYRCVFVATSVRTLHSRHFVDSNERALNVAFAAGTSCVVNQGRGAQVDVAIHGQRTACTVIAPRRRQMRARANRRARPGTQRRRGAAINQEQTRCGDCRARKTSVATARWTLGQCTAHSERGAPREVT